jgi:hypothetical protein
LPAPLLTEWSICPCTEPGVGDSGRSGGGSTANDLRVARPYPISTRENSRLTQLRLRRGAILAATVAAVLAAVSVASVATGAIPSGDGTIHAYFGNGDGSLRVRDVEAGKRCPKNFSPIEWSQQGPAGAPGQDGQDGDDGQDGQDGMNGQDGAPGVSG